ncbi:hypothetical protein EDB85DRAFT_617587 [Lactarius pseudohatsudake]|nr:hypothetical protein EDB85DRAFT_617587 [Lactarius pseudohatsudake]
MHGRKPGGCYYSVVRPCRFPCPQVNLGYLFADMFSLAQPSNNEAVDGLPIVQLSDDAELVRALITALYPIPFEIPASYDRILALLAAAQKYDMGTVLSSIRSEVRAIHSQRDASVPYLCYCEQQNRNGRMDRNRSVTDWVGV